MSSKGAKFAKNPKPASNPAPPQMPASVKQQSVAKDVPAKEPKEVKGPKKAKAPAKEKPKLSEQEEEELLQRSEVDIGDKCDGNAMVGDVEMPDAPEVENPPAAGDGDSEEDDDKSEDGDHKSEDGDHKSEDGEEGGEEQNEEVAEAKRERRTNVINSKIRIQEIDTYLFGKKIEYLEDYNKGQDSAHKLDKKIDKMRKSHRDMRIKLGKMRKDKTKRDADNKENKRKAIEKARAAKPQKAEEKRQATIREARLEQNSNMMEFAMDIQKNGGDLTAFLERMKKEHEELKAEGKKENPDMPEEPAVEVN
tara:strand:- start:3285 stop:4208 length:924 start_codon:yes stop_codon:yes gene_type:complete